jgi:hypothetical protein
VKERWRWKEEEGGTRLESVPDGGTESDGWGIGCVCDGRRDCLHPCRRCRKRRTRTRVVMSVFVVHEGAIGRAFGPSGGMSTSSWERQVYGQDYGDSDEDVPAVFSVFSFECGKKTVRAKRLHIKTYK